MLQEEIILKLQEAVGSGALEKPNEELLQVRMLTYADVC
jgi:hypothetical protein